ncbi:MAG: hypothetical protein IJG40_14585 [Oscillospiraceae bacterium]|nr:hypothetical protein [Oscillospiraceae bacterium]
MKTLITILLSCSLLLGLFAFSAWAESPLVGGWTAPDSPEITPELQELFDKATEGLLGVNYTPVALIGTQLVSGMNYCFLCEAKAVIPDAVPYYVNVTVYRDLQGNAKVTDIEGVETHSTSEIAAFVGEEADSSLTEEQPSAEEIQDDTCCCCCRRRCCGRSGS